MASKRVLLLAPAGTPLLALLRKNGHSVIRTDRDINNSPIQLSDFDFLISYGYRYILSEKVLKHFQNRCAINLHISFLPFNRGADPNFWSIYEGTPQGVTIHYLDKGIDTGDIIAQTTVPFDEDIDTLSSSYDKLHKAIFRLFADNMSNILSGQVVSFTQPNKGTYHESSDRTRLFNALKKGRENVWDTPIKEVRSLRK